MSHLSGPLDMSHIAVGCAWAISISAMTRGPGAKATMR